MFLITGKMAIRLDRNSSHFHLMAWSIPLVLTITILGLSEVDGDSMTGICFVGHQNHIMRAIFLLGPIFITLIIGGFFLIRSVVFLIGLQRNNPQIISSRANKKIRHSIIRMTLCSISIVLCMLGTFFWHSYEFSHSIEWSESLRQNIICLISSQFTDVQLHCKMETKPTIGMLQFHLICFFGSGIAMSIWIWTHSTLESWRRFILQHVFRRDQPKKLQKHKMIAQAFAKRKEFQNEGRYSISFKHHHTDPAELNFEPDSPRGSSDLTTTWANNINHFVNRRGALTCAATSSSQGGPRKNSVDSEISISVRHFSVESRRNSIDSQVSVKIAEMKTMVSGRSSRSKKTRSNKRRQDFAAASSTTRRYSRSRKESSTSVESQSIVTAMKRRTAMSQVDTEGIKRLLSNKTLASFLTNQALTTTDDEHMAAGPSLKVPQNAQIDILLGRQEQQGAIFHHENELKSSFDGGGGRSNHKGSRTNKKSRASGKRLRKNPHSRLAASRKHETRQHDAKAAAEIFETNDSFTSNCSELVPLELQSSFSGVSIAKTNSRNSKRSCDVGVQTNAHEIATQTFSSFEFNDKALKNEENQDLCSEFKSLLNKKSDRAATRKRELDVQMLLLPSK